MKGYEAKDLEALFKSAGRIRRGNPAYVNDSTYWEGGRCNWGGSHNLREDCETIASSFAKIERLKEIRDILTKCLSEKDFNTKKQNFIRKCNESTSGLRPRTGYSSSMFGICIIWADEAMSPHVERQIEGIKREVEKTKTALERETYKWVEELRRIQLEIDEIKKRMAENKRKAMNEKDPSKKAALLLLIEEDGKLLQQKYREHQEHSNKFRFEPGKYVGDLVEAMKRAIEGRGGNNRNPRSGGSSGEGNRRNPNQPNDPFGGNNWPDPDDNNIPNRTPRSRSYNQPEAGNQQMILMVVAIGVVIFFMIQKEASPSRSPEYYDY